MKSVLAAQRAPNRSLALRVVGIANLTFDENWVYSTLAWIFPTFGDGSGASLGTKSGTTEHTVSVES